MADETLLADPNIIDRINKTKEAIAELAEKEKNLITEFGRLDDRTRAVTNRLMDMQKALQDLIASLPPSQRGIISLQNEIQKLSAGFDDSTKSVFGFVESIGGAILNNAKELGKVFALSGKEVRGFVDPLGEARLLSSENTTVLGGLQQAMSRLLAAQRSSRVAFTRLGLSIRDANRFSEQYPQSLRAMSAGFSLSTKSLDEMVKKMSGVPPILTSNEAGLRGVNNLQSVMVRSTAELATTMAAFGKSAQDAADFGVRAWFDFNQTTKETTRLMELVNQTAVQNNVDLGKASEQIARASQSMGIFGGKITASARIWHTFMGSLRESGVPINAIGSMVADLTDKMASMTTQNRAFIGLMSGMARGRTALGGALQMEVNMRTPGGLEKNLEAMTSTLSRFGGGRVITLEQAARSPQLEMQFVLQRQMLGKLTGITTAEQQNRILETLEKVQRGGISRIQGSREIQSAMEKGKNIQERTLTAMERIDLTVRGIIGGKLDKLISAVNETFTGEGVGERGRIQERGGLQTLQRAMTMEPGPARQNLLRAGLQGIFSQLRNIGPNVRRADVPAPGEATVSEIFRDVRRAAEAGRYGGAPPEMPVPREVTRPPTSPFLAATPGRRGTAALPRFRAIIPPAGPEQRVAQQGSVARILSEALSPLRRTAGPDIGRMIEAIGPTRPVAAPPEKRTPEVTPAAVTRGAGGEYNINVRVSSDVPLGQAGMDNFIEKLADVIKKDMESFSISSILGHSD